MPRLEDLKKNLLEMTQEELRERIRTIREDRIIRKSKPVKDKAKTTKEKAPPKDRMRDALNSLSPEQLAALIKDMED